MKFMNWMKVFVVGTLSIGVLSSTAAIQAMAQELPKVYDASMPREQQIVLAESAAPAEVSSKATVYVLGPKGYEKAREGTNGFSCFVGRHFVKAAEKPLSRSASTPKAAALSCLSTCTVKSCARAANPKQKKK